MKGRCPKARFDLIAVMAMVTLALGPVVAAGQTVGGSWSPSRTPWGDPDLQGTWTNTTTTPLERPEDLADKEILTAEELVTRNQEVAEQVSLDNRPREETGAYNEFWAERGSLNARTSLIVDPSDGRLPTLTPTEIRRRADHAASQAVHSTDSPEDRSAYDRCISRGLPGSMMPGFYNHKLHVRFRRLPPALANLNTSIGCDRMGSAARSCGPLAFGVGSYPTRSGPRPKAIFSRRCLRMPGMHTRKLSIAVSPLIPVGA